MVALPTITLLSVVPLVAGLMQTMSDSPSFCHGLDCPAFSVVEKTDDYELRSYEAGNVPEDVRCEHFNVTSEKVESIVSEMPGQLLSYGQIELWRPRDDSMATEWSAGLFGTWRTCHPRLIRQRSTSYCERLHCHSKSTCVDHIYPYICQPHV